MKIRPLPEHLLSSANHLDGELPPRAFKEIVPADLCSSCRHPDLDAISMDLVPSGRGRALHPAGVGDPGPQDDFVCGNTIIKMGRECPAVSFDSQNETFVLSCLCAHQNCRFPSVAPQWQPGEAFLRFYSPTGPMLLVTFPQSGYEGCIAVVDDYLLPDPLAFMSKVSILVLAGPVSRLCPGN